MLKGTNILILSPYFHPEPAGSAPPITDLARYCAETDVSVAVLTARPSYPERKVYDGYRKGERDNEMWNNVQINRVRSHVSPSTGIIGRLLTEGTFAASAFLSRLLGRVSPSKAVITVCPSIFCVAIGGFFKARDGRHVAIVHDIQSGLGASVLKGGKSMQALRWLERKSLNNTDGIITLSEGMASALKELGVNTPITILPPQVDVSEIQPMPEAKGTFEVLYSGALGHKQGLGQVLDAAKILQTHGSDIHITLRGQGGTIDALNARIRGEDIQNVSIEPLIDRDKISEGFGQAHVHLVPQEPSGANFAVPSKVFSIMSAGRPFVATAQANSPLYDLVQAANCGVVVEPNAPAALADALENLKQNKAKRRSLGAAGRAYVETNVDRSVICPEIIKVALKGD